MTRKQLERQQLDSVIDAAWLRDGTDLVYATSAGAFIQGGPEGRARQVGDIPARPLVGH